MSVKINRIGECITAKNGLQMTIVAYRGEKDIDVQFSDGTLVTNKAYSKFKLGSIDHPTVHADRSRKRRLSGRVGETAIANNGHMMTIVAYRSATDLDVQFDTGELIEHRSYHFFKSGDISNNDYSKIPDVRVGDTVINTYGIPMTITRYDSSKNIDVEFSTGVKVCNKSYFDFIRGRIGHPIPYQLGTVNIEGRAYNYDKEGNFYCRCTKCKHADIMTIAEIKEHICIN